MLELDMNVMLYKINALFESTEREKKNELT